MVPGNRWRNEEEYFLYLSSRCCGEDELIAFLPRLTGFHNPFLKAPSLKLDLHPCCFAFDFVSKS